MYILERILTFKENLNVLKRLNFIYIWIFRNLWLLKIRIFIVIQISTYHSGNNWEKKGYNWIVMRLCVKMTRYQLRFLVSCKHRTRYSHLGRENVNWKSTPARLPSRQPLRKFSWLMIDVGGPSPPRVMVVLGSIRKQAY